VDFNIGFKVAPKINLYFNDVIDELVQNSEFCCDSGFDTLKKYNINGDFRFVLIDRVLNYDFDLSPIDKLTMNLYGIVKNIGISDMKAYGLDESIVITEKVPLINSNDNSMRIKRVEKKSA
jgi:KUP system potassium uptake protein